MLKNTFIKISYFCISVIGIYSFVLYFIQESFYVFPDKYYISPLDINMPQMEEKIFINKNNIPITNWYHKGNPDKPAILFFHGNKGQIARFSKQMIPYINNGYTVMMSEYQGFGNTLGTFTQENIYSDAVEAFDFLYNNLGHKKIYVFGYSMGTAPASYLAFYKTDTQGLILAAPFYSLKKIAGEKYIPLARQLIKYELPSYKFIQKYNRPLLILHGEDDTLIPYKHGIDLYNINISKNKSIRIIPNTDHAELFFNDKISASIIDWIENN